MRRYGIWTMILDMSLLIDKRCDKRGSFMHARTRNNVATRAQTLKMLPRMLQKGDY